MHDPFEALTFRHPTPDVAEIQFRTRTATRIRYWFRLHWTALLIGAAAGCLVGVML